MLLVLMVEATGRASQAHMQAEPGTELRHEGEHLEDEAIAALAVMQPSPVTSEEAWMVKVEQPVEERRELLVWF